MATRSYPFTSINHDKVFQAMDFASYYRNLLDDGRIDYTDLGIKAGDSLVCALDSVDSSMIHISAGGCIIKGVEYYTDTAATITISLPVGASIYTGYIVARLDLGMARKISIIETTDVNQDTDLILSSFTANSIRITSISNTHTVAVLNIQEEDHYAVCTTAGNTAIKVVPVDNPNFNMYTGRSIMVKFTKQNTVAFGLSLSINGHVVPITYPNTLIQEVI